MATNVTLTINNASTNHVLTTGGRGPQGVAGAPGSDAEVTQANIEAAITNDAAFLTSIGAAPTTHTHEVGDITPISSGKLVGRHGGGSGAAQEVGLDGGLEFHGANIRREALTGDVTASAGDNATTIASDAVTNAKLANMATATIKGRTTAGTGDPEDLTAAQARTLLGLGNAATMTVDSDLPTFSLPTNTTISAFGATLIDDADAATARTTLGASSPASVDTQIRSYVFPGTYASDQAAAAYGVAVNNAYRHTDGRLNWVKPFVAQIAFVGDSITVQNTDNLGYYQAIGYGVTARFLCGGEFDFARNGSNEPHFALGGTRTLAHLQTYMPAAIAANPDVIVYHGGTNDYPGGITLESAAQNVEDMILLCRAANIPLVLTPVLGSPAGVDALRSAWVASFNTLLANLATEYGLIFCDWRPLTEASPGVSAVGILTDNVHPGSYGAWQMGKTLATALNSYFTRTVISDWAATLSSKVFIGGSTVPDPYFLTPGATRPTGFTLTTTSWGGSTPTESIVPRTDGVPGNWWQIVMSTPTPGTGFATLQDAAVRYIVGTAQAGGASTITLATGASTSNSLYNNHWIWITSGTGAGQVRRITAYVGATRVATVDTAWVTTPDATSVYSVGLRQGEKLQAIADVQFNSGADIRQCGLRGFVTTDQTRNVSGDVYDPNGAVQYAMSDNGRTMTMRGSEVTTVGANTGTNTAGFRLLLSGNMTVRVSRMGYIALDRTVGQLTFTP